MKKNGKVSDRNFEAMIEDYNKKMSNFPKVKPAGVANAFKESKRMPKKPKLKPYGKK